MNISVPSAQTPQVLPYPAHSPVAQPAGNSGSKPIGSHSTLGQDKLERDSLNRALGAGLALSTVGLLGAGAYAFDKVSVLGQLKIIGGLGSFGTGAAVAASFAAHSESPVQAATAGAVAGALMGTALGLAINPKTALLYSAIGIGGGIAGALGVEAFKK